MAALSVFPPPSSGPERGVELGYGRCPLLRRGLSTGSGRKREECFVTLANTPSFVIQCWEPSMWHHCHSARWGCGKLLCWWESVHPVPPNNFLIFLPLYKEVKGDYCQFRVSPWNTSCYLHLDVALTWRGEETWAAGTPVSLENEKEN